MEKAHGLSLGESESPGNNSKGSVMIKATVIIFVNSTYSISTYIYEILRFSSSIFNNNL
jgi:hypothetical protein